jgi:hypothetical protein
MVTKPNPALMTVDEFDQPLNQERDELLAIARSRREWLRSHPNPFRLGEDSIGDAQRILAGISAQKIAKIVEDLVLLVDAIADRRLRLRTLKNINLLIGCGRDEIRNPMDAEQARVELRTKHARSRNNENRTEGQKRRRERVRPQAEEIAAAHPSESSAKIAWRLRQLKDFRDIPRRTLEEDVKAILQKLGSG